MTGRFATGMQAALNLAGTWTDITSYLYNRTQPAVTITRGRPDETSTVNPSQMTGQLNNRDGRFTSRNPLGPYYPDLTRNTPIRLSVADSGTYLRIADDAVSYISAPDSSALHLTGNFDVRVDCKPDNYQPCILACKWGGTAQAWALLLNGDGTLSWYWYDGASVNNVQSTAAIPLGRVTVRCLFQPDTAATVTFYTAPAMGGSYTQLGAAVAITASDDAASGAGQAVQAGYSATFAANYADPYGAAYQGFQGQMYELRIYNATPSLVADPVFTSQTAGATSFTDGQSNTWTVAGSCELSNRSYRYHGEMSSLPVAWDPSGRDIWVPFQASGILRRLNQGNANIWSVMKRAVSYLPDVVAYWACEDGAGSTQIASGLPGGAGVPMIFAGAPKFASNGTGFACSAALPALAKSTWIGEVPAYSGAGTGIAVRFLFIPSSSDASGTVIEVETSAGDNYAVGWTLGSGILAGVNVGGTVTSATSFIPLAAGTPVLVSLEITEAAGNITYRLWTLDLYGDTSNVSGTVPGSQTGSAQAVLVNSALGGTYLDSSVIGQITVQNAVIPVPTLLEPLTAWAGETAGNRFLRLCAENGISPRVYGFPDTTVVMGVQGIDTLANLLQTCETADNGMLYEPREAFGVGYRTLASMCNQAAQLTLDYSQAEVGDQERTPVSLTSVDDDQFTRNDVTVTRTAGQQSGSSYQAQLNDGSPMSISAPPSGVGDYTNAVTVAVNTDLQLPDAAWWLVHVGTVQGERYPQIVTGLHQPEIITAGLGYQIQDVNIGDYAAVANPPAWLPPGTIRQVVAGVTETLSSYLYQVSWNAIPESPYETGIYDDLVYGREDTDGATLASGASSGATTLSVATADALSPLWTTAAADFPFDIDVGGEQITVTNITGASSPQSFTVTRSVNGVTKSQSSGADVRLFYPPVYALT